jgi:hypothetical protein
MIQFTFRRLMFCLLWKKGVPARFLTVVEPRFWASFTLKSSCRLQQVQLEAKAKEQDLVKLEGELQLLQVSPTIRTICF